MKKATISFIFIVLLMIPAMSQAQDRTTPALVEKTFQITHAELEQVHGNVRRTLSRYGQVLVDQLGKKLMVKDIAENMPKIEKLIKGMDIAPHRLTMTVFVFEASRAGNSGDLSMIPPKVKKALDEVKDLMAYKSFKLNTSGMLNSVVKKKTRASINLSEHLLLECMLDYNPHSKFLMLNPAILRYSVRSDVVKDVVKTKELLRTDFGIGDGEVVVAGASKLNGGEKALLTIVTLKVKETK